MGCSVGEWIGANLKVDYFRVCPFSRLAMERCARTPRGPDSLSLPGRLRIVEAPIHPLGEEADGIGHAQDDELSVDQGEQRIRRVAGDDGRVLAKPQGIELI